jgi:multiple sugar transport system permease protein
MNTGASCEKKARVMAMVLANSKVMKTAKQRTWFQQKRLFPWLLVLPCLLVLFAIGLMPLFYVLLLAVTDFSFSKPLEFVGLTHFAAAVEDPRFWQGMRVTAWFVFSIVTIQLTLGLAIAWGLSRIHNTARVAALTVILLPMLLAPTLAGLMWKMLLKARYGAFDFILEQIGIQNIDWLADPTAAMIGVTVADVWQWTPFMALILFAGIQSLSHEVHEAAYVDGASLWDAFRHITLPLIRPFILLTVSLRMIDAFKTFDLIWGITKGGPGSATESIALYTHKVGFTSFDLSYAAAISLMQLVVITLLGKLLLERLNQANKDRKLAH